MEEFNQEPNDQEMSNEPSTMKRWLQDNLRIIISVLIVVFIAGGIYSYSKRTEAPSSDQNIAGISEDAEDIAQGNEIAQESETVSANEESSTPSENSADQETPAANSQENTSSISISTSQETENSFIETAVKGDSKTRLARAALANYLEKNTDSALTAEHKIYIEDYLRKNVQFDGRVYVGTSVEFSKDLIQKAIEKSKTLNENQLQNLHKYAVLVPSLS